MLGIYGFQIFIVGVLYKPYLICSSIKSNPDPKTFPCEQKPAGGAGALERHFGCDASKLVMVGDRYFTDVVFGNRHGSVSARQPR